MLGSLLASSTPVLTAFWYMLIFFAFVIWIWLLITVFADIFRRHDTSGWAKALWVIFIIIFPYLGVLIYLIAEHQGMADRNVKQLQAQQAQADEYIKSVAGSTDPAETDREGQAAAGQRRDHAGRVRRPEEEGARVVELARGARPAVRAGRAPRRRS